MSKIKEINISYNEWECADGCCYETWYEAEIICEDGTRHLPLFKNEYNTDSEERFSDSWWAKLWACKYAKTVLNEHLKMSDKRFYLVNN